MAEESRDLAASIDDEATMDYLFVAKQYDWLRLKRR